MGTYQGCVFVRHYIGNQVYLEELCIRDKLLEDLCHTQVKQSSVPSGDVH